jgi:tetratricopeptide (TPR) repeat protein
MKNSATTPSNSRRTIRTVPLLWAAPLVAGGCLILGAFVWGGTHLYQKHLIHRANELLKKGYAGLAAEQLEPHRKSLARTAEGCRTLTTALLAARRLAPLEATAQRCLENELATPEVVVGLSAAFEQTGRVNEAIRLLTDAAAANPKAPEFSHRLGLIYQEQKNIDLAVAQFLEANRRAPSAHALALDQLVFIARAERWAEAAVVADSLKDAPTDDPEVKLLLARVYQQAGRKEFAQTQSTIARTLLDKAPNKKAQLLKAYGDLLGSDTPAATPPAQPAQGPARNVASPR